MEEYQICTLSNGLRLIHRPTQSAVSYCGFTVNAGTRDEEEAYNGLAHFVEHTLFKGTTHRRASHILNRMEVGKGGVTTAQKEIEAKYGFPVASIVSMAEVKECLHNHEVAGRIVIDDDIAAAIDAYYEQWGAKE